MESIQTIPVQKTKQSQLSNVNLEQPEFGKDVSDHMFRCTFKNGRWQQPRIIPFQNISLPPTALALHYGQSIFEGMKAFRTPEGISIFRIPRHHQRLNTSLHRMCMPPVPEDLFSTALQELVRVDQDWVPSAPGSALYLRPLVFASEGRLGVKVADEYEFLIMSGPVPTLYPKPIKVKVEKHFIRAAKGGTGYAKCAGNYGGAFYPTQLAREEGFDQVIWTDAIEHEYFEESGTMNLMFVIDGVLITPPVSDSILDGVTRDSLLQLAADMGIMTEERRVGITEATKALNEGKLTEAFGAGTAAVIAPISVMGIDGVMHSLPAYNQQSIMFRLKEELDAIRYGKKEDVRGWNCIVRENDDR